MSYKNILSTISSNEPIFNVEYAILSAPVRHCFIIGTIWYLKKNNAKLKDINILEIGSWFGASTLSFAQGLETHNNANGSITCVDAWEPFFDESKNTNDVHKNMQAMLGADIAYNVFLHNVNTIKNSILCQHLKGKSDNIMPMLKKDQFDVIFIDADHTYQPVKRDILNAIPLIKDGGIICGDDLNLQMFECDQNLAKESADKDFIKDIKTGKNFHPGVTLAVDEIFGKVSSWGGFWAIQKQGDNWIAPSYKDMPISYPNHFPENKIAEAKDHMNDINI